MAKRQMIIAGNWKMNKTPSQTAQFLMELKTALSDNSNEVIAAVPFICIPAALEACEDSRIKIAAQNMHWEEKGAFTGEVSPLMLNDLGIEYVILGHSERRQYFAETDETVNKKVHSAFAHGIKPIICVGESLEQRDNNVTEEHIRYQVKIALKGLTPEQIMACVIAYEPIWAIGTGRTATSEQAEEVCKCIRDTVAEIAGKEAGDAIRIQYGGSVNAENSAAIFGMADIDGGLIGGASLKVKDFCIITGYEG